MQYDPAKHHRRSTRLPGYDYSQPGFYFVTICCYQRQRLFGEIVDGAMRLNQYGEIVEHEWLKSAVMVMFETDKPRRGNSRIAPTHVVVLDDNQNHG